MRFLRELRVTQMGEREKVFRGAHSPRFCLDPAAKESENWPPIFETGQKILHNFLDFLC